MKEKRRLSVEYSNRATDAYDRRDYKEACRLSLKALRQDPENYVALISLGNLAFLNKKYKTALKFYHRADNVFPGYVVVQINLANSFYELKNYIAADRYALAALELDSSYVPALVLLGQIRLEQEDFAAAVSYFRQAERQDTSDPWLYNSLSQACWKNGETAAALEAGFRAVEISAGGRDHQLNLGYLFYEASLEKKAENYDSLLERWQRRYGADPYVRQFVDSLCHNSEVSKINPQFVAGIFDVFAPDFEEVLTSLDYQAPARIADVLSELFSKEKQARLQILDLGCGTGFLGKVLKKYAASKGLEGVDLSAGMLAVAAEKNIYDTLTQGDIVDVLPQRKNRFDLIAAADVFTYFGALDSLFNLCFSALKNQGHLVFTASENSCSDRKWFLHAAGRFQHNKKYIVSTLEKCGFQMEKILPCKLRNEGDLEVRGWVFSAQKT